MKSTRCLPWITAATIASLAACNYTEGECYYRGQGGGNVGAGGGPIVPGGPGGFGDVPPGPQQAGDPPPPECNIAEESPCNAKCLADYEAAAAECGKIENESQRKACQDTAYASYTSCRGICTQKQNDCLEHCKELCYNIWEKCRDDCPKGDINCLSECTNALAACNRECDKKCK